MQCVNELMCAGSEDDVSQPVEVYERSSGGVVSRESRAVEVGVEAEDETVVGMCVWCMCVWCVCVCVCVCVVCAWCGCARMCGVCVRVVWVCGCVVCA